MDLIIQLKYKPLKTRGKHSKTNSLLTSTKKIALLVLLFILTAVVVFGQESTIPFDQDYWNIQGKVVEHLGKKALRGRAFLNDVEFQDGVIEVDMAFEGARCFGMILFRIQQGGNYENFYLRPHKSGFADALQYTPTFNGLGSWQLYSGDGFTAAAEIPHKRWIHVKMEIKGAQARVYLDHSPRPALVIPYLKHGVSKGALGLSGPPNSLAHFADFRYSPDEALEFEDPPHPEKPVGILSHWELSQPFKVTALDREAYLEGQDIPEIKWKKVDCDAFGLVDIARFCRKRGQQPECILAKTTIVSDRGELKKLNFGYSDEVSIFLNGNILFRGNSEFRRRDPLFTGVVGLNDAVFLPLNKGENELLLMVTETFGGWGFICQLIPPRGRAVFLSNNVMKAWETPPRFQAPESAFYHKEEGVLYITNFGGDHISKVALDGSIMEQRWISGLNRPTGISMWRDTLYVVERESLAAIDISARSIIRRFALPEAQFPNDVTVGTDGDIFISDSQRSVIYRVKDGQVSVWMESEKIQAPNGLWHDGESLIIGTSADGCFKRVRLSDQKIETLLHLGNGAVMDGIRALGAGAYLMGDWTGRLFRVSAQGEKKELINTQDAKLNLADFEYIPDKKMLVIPTLYGNKLLAYKLDR